MAHRTSRPSSPRSTPSSSSPQPEGGLLALFRLTLLAHEGEELVLVLPALLLFGWLLIVGLNKSDKNKNTQDEAPPPEPLVQGFELRRPSELPSGQAAVQPPHKG